MESDAQLLAGWIRRRDPTAFTALAERYAGLVHATCLRITGDHHAAEDLAQDVLLEFALKGGTVRSSVVGFLHATARSRALNHRRDRAVRERHETSAGRHQAMADTAPAWNDLAPVLDEALAGLPADERAVILLHILDGRSQAAVAATLGVDQATVSRRLARGLATLRTRLASAGVVLTIAALADLGAAHAAAPAPPAVLAALPQLTQAAATTTTGVLAGAGLPLLIGTAVAAVLLTGWFMGRSSPPPPPASPPAAVETPVVARTAAPPGKTTMPTSEPADAAPTSGARAPAPAKPGPFTLNGNAQQRDSMALALVAAGQAFGRSIDVTEATCRLGNAFAPGIDRKEDCASHMQVEGRLQDRALPAAAAAFGLGCERIAFPDREGTSDDAQACLRHRQVAAATVAGLQAAGRVVVVTGGWEIGGPHGFRHWAHAGILTSADPVAGILLGAHPQGDQDNPLRFISQAGYETAGRGLHAWALAPAAVAAPDDLATLRLAIDRIRGRGCFVDDGRDVFGLAAMDWWIDLMRREAGFCAPCWGRSKEGKVPMDARDNVVRLHLGAQEAVAFLRACGSRLPDAVRPHLDQAAGCYGRISALLAPVVAKDGPGSYRMLLGDLTRQQQHADAVLVPVREALAEVAGHLERAVEAGTAASTRP